MITIITAPQENYSVKTQSKSLSLFLAGGITNCPDWQSDMIQKLQADPILPLTVYNPRRPDFPIHDPTASEQQICWEYKHLKESDTIVFWFARGSDNPIVLYELGRWGNSSDKSIVVGCDPEYKRIQDVKIQTALSRPQIKVAVGWEEFVLQTYFLLGIKKMFKNFGE